MSLKIGLQITGVSWSELSQDEKREIILQIPKIQEDPNHNTVYKYYKSQYKKWIIPNANLVPLKTVKNIFRS